MDFLRNGGQSGPSRDFTVCIIRCVSRRSMADSLLIVRIAQNSQVSASKKWLTLAELTCNWQLKLVNSRKFHRCP